MMRVSLSGLLQNMADAIEDLTDGEDCFGLAFTAREVSRHCRETATGQHSLQEFAEFYCLTDDNKNQEITEVDYCPIP